MGRNHKLNLQVKGKARVTDGKKKPKAAVPGQLVPSAWKLMRKQKALRKKIAAARKESGDC